MNDTPYLDRGRYVVKHADSNDLIQIAQLEEQVFLDPLSYEDIREKCRLPSVDYLVVKEKSCLAAFFGFEVFHQYAHVLANVTHPRYRRQGLGAFVLKAAEPWAQSMGAMAFLGEVRESNTAQLRILESIGWDKVAFIPQFFSNGESAHIVMRVLSSR